MKKLNQETEYYATQSVTYLRNNCYRYKHSRPLTFKVTVVTF